MSESVTREIVLPAGAGEVWEAITEPDRMGDWFGAEVHLDLWPGGEAEFVAPLERGEVCSRHVRFTPDSDGRADLGSAASCQSTKSLRSSALRGSKSREAGSPEQR